MTLERNIKVSLVCSNSGMRLRDVLHLRHIINDIEVTSCTWTRPYWLIWSITHFISAMLICISFYQCGSIRCLRCVYLYLLLSLLSACIIHTFQIIIILFQYYDNSYQYCRNINQIYNYVSNAPLYW